MTGVLTAFLCWVGSPCISRALAAAFPRPVFARTVVVYGWSGTVSVRTPHGTLVALHHARAVAAPVGSRIDTSHGSAVLITASSHGGHLQTADLTGGTVTVAQRRSQQGATTLRVPAPSGHSCSGASSAAVRSYIRVTHPTRHRTRYRESTDRPLAGAADVPSGTFVLAGTYETATNDGPASWRLSDACTGTTAANAAGKVTATITKTGTTYPLLVGQSYQARCEFLHADESEYCGAFLSGSLNSSPFYSVALYTDSGADSFDLCTTLGGVKTCSPWSFSAPDRLTVREGIVTCAVSALGTYTFSFEVNGTPLNLSFPYTATTVSSAARPCSGTDIGAQYTPGSQTSSGLDANLVYANEYPVLRDAWVYQLEAYLIPTGASGKEAIAAVIYTDDGGHPGTLVAATQYAVVSQADQPGYWYFNFSSATHLQPGNYWLGIVTGGTSGVVAVPYDKGATLATTKGSVLQPPTTFGTPTTTDARISLHALYYAQDPTVSNPGS
jgi:hypothetical protein